MKNKCCLRIFKLLHVLNYWYTCLVLMKLGLFNTLYTLFFVKLFPKKPEDGKC